MTRYVFAAYDYNRYFYLKDGRINFNMTTNNVDKVNDGQITSYPFVLPDKFLAAPTHAQYYQIDMNEDGDNEVRVM